MAASGSAHHPAKHRVQTNTDEDNDREPPAGRRLERVGLERATPERLRRTAFLASEPPHHTDRDRGHADGERADIGPVLLPERRRGFRDDERREEKEREPNEPQRMSLEDLYRLAVSTSALRA